MEAGDKLKELNMSVDEIDRLTKAFKDEKFREMLRDYACELSDPENKKRYEEEIKLLEQERGNTIEFIHPKPFRALRTSMNGKHKCFINICTNEKVGKPESKWGVSEQGHRGQHWSLPYSLHPGRQDTDPKGNKIMIYDVIFHPDTLHIASKNKRFMEMVEGTAIQGIQDAFKVTLDKNNVREMNTKYKGTLQPCVLRKPIPGYKTKEPSEEPLAFPYPDAKRPTTSLQTKPTESTKSSSEPKSVQIQPQKAKGPTKPNYTVKYRSVMDLQDFRCSRDSAQSPRPKEIVVTVDVPLLKAATDASLEVKGRLLLLESKKPAYTLELLLAYPVDEDKGEARFNKQRGQLTVTLPVLPSNEAFDFAVGPAQTSVGDDERSEVEEEEKSEEEQRGVEDLRQQARVEKGKEGRDRGQEKVEERKGQECVEEEEKLKEQKQENGKEVGRFYLQKRQQNEDITLTLPPSNEAFDFAVGPAQTSVSDDEKGEVEEEDKWKEKSEEGLRQQSRVEKGEERGQEKVDRQERKGQEFVEEEEKLKEQKQENGKEVGRFNLQKTHKKHPGPTCFQCDTVDVSSAEEENSLAVDNRLLLASPETETQPVLITAEHSSCVGREEVNLKESAPKTVDTKEETEETRGSEHGNEEVETDAAFLPRRSGEESQTSTHNQNNIKDFCCISQESSEMPATDEANKPSRGGSGDRVGLFSEELVSTVDDLPTEQTFHNAERDNKPPPVMLREIDEDGNEKIITDHSTSAGFIFQNSLMYELD